jgi:hypothetical protein
MAFSAGVRGDSDCHVWTTIAHAVAAFLAFSFPHSLLFAAVPTAPGPHSLLSRDWDSSGQIVALKKGTNAATSFSRH